MSRLMARTVVRTFLYPTFLDPLAVVMSSLTYASTAWRGFVTVGHPASRRLPPSQTVLQFLPAEPTRLQRAAGRVRRLTFQWNPPQPSTSCTVFCRRLLPSPRTNDLRPRRAAKGTERGICTSPPFPTSYGFGEAL